MKRFTSSPWHGSCFRFIVPSLLFKKTFKKKGNGWTEEVWISALTWKPTFCWRQTDFLRDHTPPHPQADWLKRLHAHRMAYMKKEHERTGSVRYSERWFHLNPCALSENHKHPFSPGHAVFQNEQHSLWMLALDLDQEALDFFCVANGYGTDPA